MDEQTNISELKEKLRKFALDRDWKEFHTPKDLAIGVCVEASEILEHFRFRNREVLKEYLSDPENKREISHEIADVFSFLIRLADELDIDLSEAVSEKMKKNEARFPLGKSNGKKWMILKKAEKK